MKKLLKKPKKKLNWQLPPRSKTALKGRPKLKTVNLDFDESKVNFT